MRRIRIYVKETVDELLYKVSWPSWEDLQSSTMLVIVASSIIAVLVYGMDMASSNTMKALYRLFYA